MEANSKHHLRVEALGEYLDRRLVEITQQTGKASNDSLKHAPCAETTIGKVSEVISATLNLIDLLKEIISAIRGKVYIPVLIILCSFDVLCSN